MNRTSSTISGAAAWGFGLACALGFGTATADEDKKAPAPEAPDFAAEVAPILAGACLNCHDAENRKGGISLATPDDLVDLAYIAPGKPDESDLIALVTTQPGEDRPQMPLKGDPLDKAQVETLRRWIATGAAWPEGLELQPSAEARWWSLRPLADAEPPEVPDAWAAWSDNPIDRFILARLDENDLEPSPPADKRTLIRRLSYDLTGLPPTPEAVERFLADDRPDAYERLVDRLLASPRYGEQWGRHWLDVVRFGESNGFERNVIINNLWPFRDYVIQSFNADKPFDRLIREHLAGDALAPGDPGVAIGTAFLVCGPYDNVGNQDPVQAAQIRANTIDEMVRATSEAFLGLTVGCARCHDHKFDPIPQEDYYGLYATFAGVRHGSRVIADAERRQRDRALREPLEQQKRRIETERQALTTAVRERAAQNASQYGQKWTRPPVDRTGTEERFEPIVARRVRLVIEGLDVDPNRAHGCRIEEFEVWTAGDSPRNVALAKNGGSADGPSRVAEDFADAYSADLTIDGRFGARWIAGGTTLTLTFAQPERIERVWFSSDKAGNAGAHPVATFLSDYRIEVSEDGETWATVADSSDRQPVNDAHRAKRLFDREITEEERSRLAELDRELGRINRELAQIKPPPSWWAGTFHDAPGPFHVFKGGDPQKPGDEVKPSSLSALEGVAPGYDLESDASEQARRLALADWIASDANPLTARVLANRLWHSHFGTGIVATPSDFGAMGAEPTHPALLDWLAGQVIDQDWRLKPIHRLIVTSKTYQQSSAFRPEAAAIDKDARLLWRSPPRRLTGEQIRDTLLSLAGRLQDRMGGPGFRLYRYLEDNVATYVPLDRPGPETDRRAVYHQNARAMRVDLLTDFDCPDPAFAAPRRSVTTTPLQALTMLNHAFTLDMSEAFAERLEREVGEDPDAQIRRAFRLAYGRAPDEPEFASARALVERHGLAALGRALFNTNELIVID